MTTQAVLLEIGNALSKQRYRVVAVQLFESLITDPSADIIPLSDDLYNAAFNLFRHRLDKQWGQLQVSSSELERSSFELQVSSSEVQRSSFELQVSSSELERSSLELQRPSFELQRSHFKQQIPSGEAERSPKEARPPMITQRRLGRLRLRSLLKHGDTVLNHEL